jgi:hypothetical protein
MKSMEKASYDEFFKNKVWSKEEVSKYLTTPAVSAIEYCMSQIDHYASLKVSDYAFHVIRSSTSSVDSLIPRFRRLYLVSIENSIMKCSCCYHECNGLPCNHIAHVLSFHFKGWKGFGKYDVSTYWWSLKYLFAVKNNSDESIENLRTSLSTLQDVDSKGVFIDYERISLDTGLCYKYGNKSEEKYTTYTKVPSILHSYPLKAHHYCMNYSSACIFKSLTESNELAFWSFSRISC